MFRSRIRRSQIKSKFTRDAANYNNVSVFLLKHGRKYAFGKCHRTNAATQYNDESENLLAIVLITQPHLQSRVQVNKQMQLKVVFSLAGPTPKTRNLHTIQVHHPLDTTPYDLPTNTKLLAFQLPFIIHSH